MLDTVLVFVCALTLVLCAGRLSRGLAARTISFGSEPIDHEDGPRLYWVVIGIYAALASCSAVGLLVALLKVAGRA